MASPPAPDPLGPGPELPAPVPGPAGTGGAGGSVGVVPGGPQLPPDAELPGVGGAGAVGGTGMGGGAGVAMEGAGRQKPGANAGDLAAALAGLPPEVADLVVAAAGAGQPDLPAPDGTRRRRRSRTSPDRVQRSFYLPRDLVDRARAAVSATMRRPGEAYNISQLAGRALENEVRRLERLYNGGQPFPPVAHVRSGPSPEGVERIRTGVTVPRRRRA